MSREWVLPTIAALVMGGLGFAVIGRHAPGRDISVGGDPSSDIDAPSINLTPAQAYFLSNLGGYGGLYWVEPLKPIEQYDVAGDGLDTADIAHAQRIIDAAKRAEAISAVLRYDLNGDYAVTRAEIMGSADQQQSGSMQETAARLIGLHDANRDERITIEEVGRSVPESLDGRFDSALRPARLLLSLDPNHDGHLTLGEGKALAATAVALIDTNRDGAVSNGERKAAQNLISDAQGVNNRNLNEIAPKAGIETPLTVE